ncbi:MBL fold metallo-hydrolase [Brevibacillus sp. SYP-B805]|uniref:YtnP family quorum-quenching lactonase n=1 Tax=Brevibacillus sp. SYP-B805 TaxID=1578199 RepID=UPI0013EB7296|nr:MBL fold metallo-hydrolase [Brevibacillus sp. SYP-B805]NGQ95380.1 MBL fold metallo-hydrolase [Brevibacillus sp. SYP-B805]
MDKLRVGEFALTWLYGGISQLDGGAMFGVVPKPLWSKRYPNNELNQIPLRADPILVEAHGKRLLIESGLGRDRLTEKQKRNFGLLEESLLHESLAALGLSAGDIDIVMMTHMHYDHANGLVSKVEDRLTSTFPNAVIYVQETEWNEMRAPNIRSRNTYWEENWRPIQQQVETFGKEHEVLPGIVMHHTGGHSDGHAIIRMESQGEVLLHLADLLPTHAHQNPLWVMAYDDYPMTSIFAKEKWIAEGIKDSAWFSFYHDALYRALKWNEAGEIIEKVEIGERHL